MIRHARLHLSAAIASLAVAVIEPAFGTLLVAAVGTASLAHPCKPAAGVTAVALTAITTGTQVEHGAAFAVPANP